MQLPLPVYLALMAPVHTTAACKPIESGLIKGDKEILRIFMLAVIIT